jgi:flagellar motility protein MotE (MotC chaperone)
MATSTPPHASLVRAAAVEEERVDRALQQLSHRRETLAAEIANLEAEMGELQERRRLLGQLVDRPVDTPGAAGHAPRTGVTPVRGRQLRIAAGRMLWRTVGADEVHYREWFERLLQEGYAVGGRDPLASFLTNIRDSPAVARGTRQGFYRLDPALQQAVAREIDEARAELADVEAELRQARDANDNALVERLRGVRDGLNASLKRLDARREELAAVFDGAG